MKSVFWKGVSWAERWTCCQCHWNVMGTEAAFEATQWRWHRASVKDMPVRQPLPGFWKLLFFIIIIIICDDQLLSYPPPSRDEAIRPPDMCRKFLLRFLL